MPSRPQLEALARDNPGWQIEVASDGELLLSPTSSENGPRNTELLVQLQAWNRRTGYGKVFDSSSGFTMPDGAVLSPDASCIPGDVWARLTGEERSGFAPVCPSVCIEIASRSDRWADVTAKIDRYAAYGASYALAIDPQTGAQYTTGQPPQGLFIDVRAVIDAAS